MSKTYQDTQAQVCEFLRDHYGLSKVEAMVILDDLLMNLEAMVADWTGGDKHQDTPEWQRDRIAAAVLALGQNMHCDSLSAIGRDLVAAVKSEKPASASSVSPLQEFSQGMRKAMPQTRRRVAD